MANDTKANTPEARAAAIRRAVRAVKRGTFTSYGEIARRAGLPGRARLVGQVLRESGDEQRLPWHRVTGAQGRIAFPVGSVNARKQLRLLASEGVKTRGNRALADRTPGTRKSLDALLWKL
jgi:methylated-DNA-protein-cysteine methyltransferase-like protein